MKDLIFFIKTCRFFIALIVLVISWIVLTIVLVLFIKNDVASLIISTALIFITLYLYTKELIRE